MGETEDSGMGFGQGFDSHRGKKGIRWAPKFSGFRGRRSSRKPRRWASEDGDTSSEKLIVEQGGVDSMIQQRDFEDALLMRKKKGFGDTGSNHEGSDRFDTEHGFFGSPEFRRGFRRELERDSRML
ncbi:hypothetical protein U1Q18_039853 [Sarracenia purpurea var. burkii]